MVPWEFRGALGLPGAGFCRVGKGVREEMPLERIFEGCREISGGDGILGSLNLKCKGLVAAKSTLHLGKLRSSIRLEIVRELTGVEAEKSKNFSSHDLESLGHEKRRH